ncbi:MAG: HIT family protein [Patescibacteria group bacterium]|nr:HIT family protein [Patescibacteria group bacterium]
MQDCIFCKIISGEIPGVRVYEDEKFLAFLDINPVNPGHTLVVPKKHFENILDTDEDVLCDMGKVLKKIGQAVCRGMGTDAFNLMQNNGRTAGQVVSHLHWHIVPRYPDDGIKLWPGNSYPQGEAVIVAEKIKAAF